MLGSPGAINDKELAAADADGVQGVAQMGRGEVGLRLWAVEAPAGGHDANRRAIREHPDFALRGDSERSVRPENQIQPGLQTGRQREVVHRKVDNKQVRDLQLGDQALGQGKGCAIVRIPVQGRAQAGLDKSFVGVRQERLCQIAAAKLQRGTRRADPFAGALSQSPTAGVRRPRAGADVEKRAHSTPVKGILKRKALASIPWRK